MGVERNKELGDFFRKHREKIKPEQVGLPEGIRRRTSGLRREEVAFLSGVGVTWYTWLEQGKEINVSNDILESLARTFMLNENEKRYMYKLAGRVAEQENFVMDISVDPVLMTILDNLKFCPSFIIDMRWNVLAWNRAAEAAFGNFGLISKDNRNLVWMMFNNKEYKELFIDWNKTAKGMLSRFRLTSDMYIEDPWMIKFIDNMKKSNDKFRAFWEQHEIQSESIIKKKIMHPVVGKLVFDMSCFEVQNNNNLSIIINTPSKEYFTDKKMEKLMEDIIG